MGTKSRQKLPQSQNPTNQMKPAPQRLLPVQPSQPAIAGRKEPVWRIVWPKLAPAKLAGPDPGFAIIKAVNDIAADLARELPADAYLRRLFIRHESLLREGEGVDAATELEAIDHYVAEKAMSYARLRRKNSKEAGFSVTKSAAFCVVAYNPAGKARAVITFSITGRGHEARSAVEIQI